MNNVGIVPQYNMLILQFYNHRLIVEVILAFSAHDVAQINHFEITLYEPPDSFIQFPLTLQEMYKDNKNVYWLKGVARK